MRLVRIERERERESEKAREFHSNREIISVCKRKLELYYTVFILVSYHERPIYGKALCKKKTRKRNTNTLESTTCCTMLCI